MAPPMVRNPLIQLFQGCPATTSSREHEVKVDSMTGIRPPVSPSGKGSPCAPGDEARHEIMDLSGTHAASPHLSAYVHACMDGLVPRGTSILGYSDSLASFKPTGHGRYGRHGGVPPPSDAYILPPPPPGRSASYYSFSRIMTSAIIGDMISSVETRSTGKIG